MEAIKTSLTAISSTKRWIFLGVILLTFLSWTAVTDQLATSYINDQLIQATLAYGTGKLIAVGLSTFSMLAPLASTVESFNSVMEYVLVSLVLQKLLISFGSDFLFNIILTLSAIFL